MMTYSVKLLQIYKFLFKSYLLEIIFFMEYKLNLISY